MRNAALSARRPAFRLRMPPRQLIWVGVAASVIWAAAQANLFSGALINPGGWALVMRLVDGLLHPNFSPAFLRLTLDSTLITLSYAVLGTFFSLVIGMVGGILSSEVWWQAHGFAQETARPGSIALRFYRRSPWLAARTLLAVPRSLHEIVWGLIFVNIFGLVPLTAIFAIAVPFGAICAKVFSEILDEQPRQPFLAMLNAGAPPLQAFFYALFPSALPNLISYSFYRFECSIRSATVLGIIGAGGLGYQILLSLQSLRYQEFLPMLIALLLLSGLTDVWSSRLRQALGGSTRIEIQTGINHTASNSSIGSTRSAAFLKGSLISILLLTIFALVYLKPDFSSILAPRTTQLLEGILRDSFPPRMPDGGLLYLLRLSGQTLAISILAMAAVGPLAMAAAFVGSGRLRNLGQITATRQSGLSPAAISSYLVRMFFLIARAVPTPIWVLVILFVVFPGILPGAVALALHNWGITGRLMVETVDNMDERPLVALQSLGASPGQTFMYGALPDVFPGFISYIFYRWENCIRETVVIGIVGAGGLGRLLSEQLSNFDYPAITSTLIALILLTILVDLLSSAVRRQYRS